MEAVEGYSFITGSTYRSICHLKGESLGVHRVVYRDKQGRLVVHNRGKLVEVYKDKGRYYEVGYKNES